MSVSSIFQISPGKCVRSWWTIYSSLVVVYFDIPSFPGSIIILTGQIGNDKDVCQNRDSPSEISRRAGRCTFRVHPPLHLPRTLNSLQVPRELLISLRSKEGKAMKHSHATVSPGGDHVPSRFTAGDS